MTVAYLLGTSSRPEHCGRSRAGTAPQGEGQGDRRRGLGVAPGPASGGHAARGQVTSGARSGRPRQSRQEGSARQWGWPPALGPGSRPPPCGTEAATLAHRPTLWPSSLAWTSTATWTLWPRAPTALPSTPGPQYLPVQWVSGWATLSPSQAVGECREEGGGSFLSRWHLPARLPAGPARPLGPSSSAASFQGPTGLFRADGWQVWISMSMGRALPGKLVNKPPAPLGRLCRC